MQTGRSRFFDLFHRSLAEVEAGIDRIRYREGRHDGKMVQMLTYAGYRNADEARFGGRIVEYRTPLDAGESTLSKLRAMLAIYESDEVPGVRIVAEGYGGRHEAISDDEGYFEFRVPLNGRDLPEKTRWDEVTLSVESHEAKRTRVTAPVLAPGTSRRIGVISDIDDTVVETGATNFLKNWRRVLVDQPGERLAVPGASKLYRMLVLEHDAPHRPVFYVSSSPWNLYGFITEFMELNGIPHGPMFLKDYGIDQAKFIAGGHDTHKLAAIERIIAFYPELKFLLIGDNGQQDVEVYAEVVADFPDRVAGVFIRDVSGNCRAGPNGERLAAIEAAGVPVYCGSSFEDAPEMLGDFGLGGERETEKAVLKADPKATEKNRKDAEAAKS